MKVQNRRKMEESVIDELKEHEVPFNQVLHVNRLTAFWSVIPEPWDDKSCAAWSEYHNKTHSFAQNDEHYSKRD
jgi:hypothetical protein